MFVATAFRRVDCLEVTLALLCFFVCLQIGSQHPHSKRKSPLPQKVNWALEHYGEADQIDIVSCYAVLKQNKYICHCMSELDFYRDVLKLAMHGKFEFIIGQHGEFIIKRPQEMFIKRVLRKGFGMLADVSVLCSQALGAAIGLPVNLIRDKLYGKDYYSVGSPLSIQYVDFHV